MVQLQPVCCWLLEAFSDRYITDDLPFIFQNQCLHIDLKTKQQPEWLTEYRFSKLPALNRLNKSNPALWFWGEIKS